MMAETVQALSEGRHVAVATLFEFQFLSRTVRFWDGTGKLTAGGSEWDGSGKVITVSGLEQAAGLGAGAATFTLSGTTPELLAAAVTAEIEVKNRPCAVYIQFLSDPYTVYDEPQAVWAGNMDTLVFKGDVRNQSITLTAESLFVERIRAPYGYMTDTDQQARWPGDRGFEFMPKLINKTVPWLTG